MTTTTGAPARTAAFWTAVALFTWVAAGCSRNPPPPAAGASAAPRPNPAASPQSSPPADQSAGRPRALDEGPGPGSLDRAQAAARQAGDGPCRGCGVVEQMVESGPGGDRELSSGGVTAPAGSHYNVLVRLDSGTHMTVRARALPQVSVGSAVEVVDGELVAR